jgi:hypothetical protein
MDGLPDNDNVTRRNNYHVVAEERKRWRRDAALLMPPCKEPFRQATLDIVFRFSQNRGQGIDAYIGAVKPVIDAFIDRGYLDDDGWRYLTEIKARAVKGQNGFTMTLREVEREGGDE